MWQDVLEQLRTSEEVPGPVIWADVEKEREHAMLHQLFTEAVGAQVLSPEQVERFLCRVTGIPLPKQDAAALPGASSFRNGLEEATLELLDLDEKLSPLCLKLFGKRLLADADREALRSDIARHRRQSQR